MTTSTRCLLTGLLLAAAAPALAQNPAAVPATAQSNVSRIDRGHSELTFSIRHMVSRVRGQFNDWNGTITGALDDWENAVVNVTIDGSSVDRNHERRDADLRGKDHFEVETYPAITLRSTKIERGSGNVRPDVAATNQLPFPHTCLFHKRGVPKSTRSCQEVCK